MVSDLSSANEPHFRHYVDARQRGLRLLPVGIGLTIAGIAMLWAWWTIIFGIVGVILLLAGSFFLIVSLSWIVFGGAWDISVSRDGVRWRAPPVGEESFELPMDEIKHVEYQVRDKVRKDGSCVERRRYYLVGHGGQRHELASGSGVDTQCLVSTLCRSGVPFLEIIKD